jgi:hypothetical protein
MPLHRDVFWVGRQWAVTGYGMQAVDQKQKSKFDIEIARLWDDDLAEGLFSERWFNPVDFSEGLAIARARYPAPPDRLKPTPKPREMVSPPRETAVKLQTPAADPAKSDAAKFAMRIDGGCARFTTMWRVRIHR